MKLISYLLLLLYAAWVSADSAMPASCKPVAVTGESVTLSAKTPLLVLIHNLSKSDFWITHPVSEPSASAGWSSRLQAGHWSALALDKESFEISCIESKPGHEQQVPCAGAISVCTWTPENMPAQSSGTFWAAEDMTLPALTEHLGQRGFALPGAGQ
ncbi:hypothetical protein [Legionella jordanis]|uniref:Enhanced entry protein EnhB n=1 Tax=Legionella jordanis TaxID=456 RepID=A0A0W0VD03_9GAMM|nr:hypothetical protein [Legionella jordanis]KTD18002.1 hypothetical protein Ljor_2308 [Legionella jordanis]RMX02309.1 hypothetical protein EAW55_08605 [Legionella jordanis]RMX21206.1 hypothetical protein EAS68_03265 [Legionella jordanis]VEH13906.1 Uncharacterised protein [Legionella jordanis]HAT8714287.1 hypothetical protein [Legionella jordanis]